MPKQFKRLYDLTITDSFGLSRIIKDLRVSFEVVKSVRSYPNLAKIEIYNPNAQTLSYLEDKFSEIVFNVGYEGNVRLIFKGQIRNIVDTRQDVDRVVTVYAGDGEQDWQNAIFNSTIDSNVGLSAVLEDIQATFPNTVSGDTSLVDIPADKLRPQSLSGASKDILDRIANEYGFSWSIQDGAFEFVPNDKPISENEAVLINPETGMIGSPIITEIGADVTSLLNPSLQPNKLFTIESAANEVVLGDLFFRDVTRTRAEGTYKVQEVIHKGDTHDNEWSSTVRGILANVG